MESNFIDIVLTVFMTSVYGSSVVPRVIQRHSFGVALAVQFFIYALLIFLVLAAVGQTMLNASWLCLLHAAGATLIGVASYRSSKNSSRELE